MIDLDAMNRDPWPTWPVDKNELRILVEENEKLRAALQKYADEEYNGYNACGGHARAALEGGKTNE
jgi:collagenase-like PrtC family protease